MNQTLKNYVRKGAYLLIPLAALTAGYVGGRVHQYTNDQAVVVENFAKIDNLYENKQLGEGVLRVSEEMIKRNPGLHGLALKVDGMIKRERQRDVPTTDEVVSGLGYVRKR